MLPWHPYEGICAANDSIFERLNRCGTKAMDWAAGE